MEQKAAGAIGNDSNGQREQRLQEKYAVGAICNGSNLKREQSAEQVIGSGSNLQVAIGSESICKVQWAGRAICSKSKTARAEAV